MAEPHAKHVVLLADIGGTNSRFALAGSDGRPAHMLIIENDTVPNLEGAIARYLEKTGARPSAAVLAVAAPLESEEVALTNRDWRFRPGELARRFGFAKLRLVNDFEAIAWALTRLTSDDAHPLGPVLVARPGVRVALGPGTGLGVAALVPVDGRWHVLASEGGHASFGPQTPEEVEIPAALATAQLFVRFLGRFAGGLALTFKAVGGVYVAGGVASRLGKLLDAHAFRAAFEAHPPYQALLASIPTWLMSRSEPGLLGFAVLADEFVNG